LFNFLVLALGGTDIDGIDPRGMYASGQNGIHRNAVAGDFTCQGLAPVGQRDTQGIGNSKMGNWLNGARAGDDQ
jgi:hypothetical protein